MFKQQQHSDYNTIYNVVVNNEQDEVIVVTLLNDKGMIMCKFRSVRVSIVDVTVNGDYFNHDVLEEKVLNTALLGEFDEDEVDVESLGEFVDELQAHVDLSERQLILTF